MDIFDSVLFLLRKNFNKKKKEKTHLDEQFKLKFYVFMTYQLKIIRLSHV